MLKYFHRMSTLRKFFNTKIFPTKISYNKNFPIYGSHVSRPIATENMIMPRNKLINYVRCQQLTHLGTHSSISLSPEIWRMLPLSAMIHIHILLQLNTRPFFTELVLHVVTFPDHIFHTHQKRKCNLIWVCSTTMRLCCTCVSWRLAGKAIYGTRT